MRHSYRFQIMLMPDQPLSHGSGNEGNVQVLRRTQRNVCQDGEWVALEVPAISGSAFKAVLREAAVAHLLEEIGVQDGSVSRDGLRLLLKGGKVAAAGQSVQHDEIRSMRRTCPPLAVFGFMDGGNSSPGQLQSCELVPYTSELVEAGFFRGCEVDLPPIPEAMTSAEVTYYRHDQDGSRLSRFQTSDDRPKATGSAKRDRREACESMPHTFEVIPAGTPLLGTIRLQGANEVELACFLTALHRWVEQGAHLGGGFGKGHGVCSLRSLRMTRIEAGLGSHPVQGISASPAQDIDLNAMAATLGPVYRDYLRSVREDALAMLAGA